MKLVLLLVAACVGCGSVTMADLESDAGTAGAAEGGSAGTSGTAGAPGKPLGAGCTDDDQCGSNVCATGMCCDARPGICSTCVGGYKTPVPDGAVTCGVCSHGVLLPSQDGTSCGSTCGGEQVPTGLGPPNCSPNTLSCTYTKAINSACYAGVCVPTSDDCAKMVCPAGCAAQFRGCLLNVGGASSGAKCYCVNTGGNVCH